MDASSSGEVRGGQPPHHRRELDQCSTAGVRWSPSALDGAPSLLQMEQRYMRRWQLSGGSRLLPPVSDRVGAPSVSDTWGCGAFRRRQMKLRI
ncbi:hypothetical protein Q3G72_009412 [Acer saccharum]|nr:hypothetical protein Q3G72_009412 [Acer saccharum]